jgi:hypothetical protein
MFNLRCTAKLLRRLKCDPGAAATSTTRLGDWYGNLFNVGRQQYAMFMSERSLLTIVTLTREIDPPTERLGRALRPLLKELKVASTLIDEEIGQMEACAITATDNRSALGSMNDLIFQAKFYLGESKQLSLAELQQRLANTPMKLLDYRFASEAVTESFVGQEKPTGTA